LRNAIAHKSNLDESNENPKDSRDPKFDFSNVVQANIVDWSDRDLSRNNSNSTMRSKKKKDRSESQLKKNRNFFSNLKNGNGNKNKK